MFEQSGGSWWPFSSGSDDPIKKAWSKAKKSGAPAPIEGKKNHILFQL